MKNKINDYKKKGQITTLIKYKKNDITEFGLNKDNIKNEKNLNLINNMKLAMEKELNKKEEIEEKII